MKTENIEATDPITGETTQHILIDRGNGEFTSMLKSIYDEMIKAQDEATVI
jgi:hypothetical protein